MTAQSNFGIWKRETLFEISSHWNQQATEVSISRRTKKKTRFDLFLVSGVVWRIKCTDSALVCAAGSRNSTEDTKVIMLDFDRTTICS
jgi:hypothetical protein